MGWKAITRGILEIFQAWL